MPFTLIPSAAVAVVVHLIAICVLSRTRRGDTPKASRLLLDLYLLFFVIQLIGAGYFCYMGEQSLYGSLRDYWPAVVACCAGPWLISMGILRYLFVQRREGKSISNRKQIGLFFLWILLLVLSLPICAILS